MGSLGVGWSRVPVRCVREDLLESAWADGFRVGPCVRGPCGGLGTGRQVLAVPGRTGVAWWAAVYGVTQSRTRLKRLSSSSSILVHIL